MLIVYRFCDLVVDASDLWKTGTKREHQLSLIGDITHGAYFRRSRLSAKATESEKDDLRLGLILGYDDLEIANPLGVARGKHKTACFYLAVANLPAALRFEHCNLCVLMLVLEKVLRKCGAVQVVAGADGVTGEIVRDDFSSFGAQFRASVNGETFVEVCCACLELIR